MIYLYKVKEKNFALYFAMSIISLSALASFSLAMGIVHTIGWPLLKWPSSYNSMGFYPLHFVLLISSTILLKVLSGNLEDRTMKTRIILNYLY